MRRPPVLLLAATALAAACGGEKPAASSAESAAAAAPVLRPPPPSEEACPRDGTWRPCLLEERMVNAGVGFRAAGDTLRIPDVAVPGVRYRAGRTAVLVAFFYADSAALAGQVARIEAQRRVPPADTTGGWTPPTLIRSANLAALLFDASPTQVERMMLAITAGPPQPRRPAP